MKIGSLPKKVLSLLLILFAFLVLKKMQLILVDVIYQEKMVMIESNVNGNEEKKMFLLNLLSKSN